MLILLALQKIIFSLICFRKPGRTLVRVFSLAATAADDCLLTPLAVAIMLLANPMRLSRAALTDRALSAKAKKKEK